MTAVGGRGRGSRTKRWDGACRPAGARLLSGFSQEGGQVGRHLRCHDPPEVGDGVIHGCGESEVPQTRNNGRVQLRQVFRCSGENGVCHGCIQERQIRCHRN